MGPPTNHSASKIRHLDEAHRHRKGGGVGASSAHAADEDIAFVPRRLREKLFKIGPERVQRCALGVAELAVKFFRGADVDEVDLRRKRGRGGYIHRWNAAVVEGDSV